MKRKNKNKYIKSPFNYYGGKYKLLNQINQQMPSEIATFIDVFGGGFNVGINQKSEAIIYNDIVDPVVDLFKYLNNYSEENIIQYIKETIKKYGLNKNDKLTFNKFREYYNNSENKNVLDFYILTCYSFNYSFRFNNNMEYNMPHGTNRSSFNKNMEKKLKLFINELHKKNVSFMNMDCLEYGLINLFNNKSDLLFVDPPYLITTGSYNDGNRGFKNWTLKNEKELYKQLDEVDAEEHKFVLTNCIYSKGRFNKYLSKWLDNNIYHVIDLNNKYQDSYNCKNKGKDLEVLIRNYGL